MVTTGKSAMVTERVQIRAPWLLRGHGEGCHGCERMQERGSLQLRGYWKDAMVTEGKAAMVTERVQGRATWLLKG